MQSILICALVTIPLCGCGRSTDASLAAQGNVGEGAPVQAVASIVINAPLSRVWDLLADIRRWPSWQPDIGAVSIRQAPAVGVPFEWTTGGGRIHSRLALFEPRRRLAWTGRLLVFRAIHVWTISAMAGGRTSVETRESMSGWPIGWFYGSGELLEADQRWLLALRRRAES